ncbi:MAG: diguanylate cyclase [Anaerolineales bacterium]
MLLVVVIDLLGLTGWLIHRPLLPLLLPGYLPMAPATVLIFLALCALWFIRIYASGQPWVERSVRAALMAILVVVIFLVIHSTTGRGPDLEAWLYPALSAPGSFANGRISSLTSLGFFLAIPAVFLSTWEKPGVLAKRAAAILNLVIFTISSIAILTFIFGVLPSYQDLSIPLSLATSISFCFFGLGLLLHEGPASWPASQFIGPSIKARLLRAFVPILTLVILTEGFLAEMPAIWLGIPVLKLLISVVVVLIVLILSISLIGANMDADLQRGRHAQTLQEAVYRIAAATETTRSLDELYPQIHQIIASVMPAENFYITLYDEAHDLLHFPYFKDAADVPFMGGIQPGKGLTAYVLRTGRSLLCTQAVHDELERRGEVILLGVPSAIWLGVPLMIEGKTIGAMVVQHYTDSKAYTEREQHMLEFVSTQVAIAIDRKRAEDALRQSEAEMRALFASMHDVVLVIDRNGVYRQVAPSSPELLIGTPEELFGRPIREFFPPEQVDAFMSAINQVLDTGQTVEIEYDLPIGGRSMWFVASISPLTEESTLWVAHNITDRKRFESVQNALYRITQTAITSEGTDALYSSIHSILGELIPAENFFIALVDPATGLVSFPYYIDQFDQPPLSPVPAQGLTGYIIRTERSLLATRQDLDQLARQDVEMVGTVCVEWLGVPLKVNERLIGVIAVQSYREDVHFNQDGLNILEFVSTQVAQAIERKRMEQEIRNLSLTDDLTWLYNRRGFTLLAEQEIKMARRTNRTMLLFFGDVDHLKSINDTHGHAQGDLALQEVSAILKETFRDADILARLGGDEFVVLAVDASLESAETILNRIQSGLEKRNLQGRRPYHLTMSMGIARCDPESPATVNELIAQADALMYQQKHSVKTS